MAEEHSDGKIDNMDNWPLSNYPILMALLLLVATALSLGLGGSEAYANQLAIYAYFLLVIGVAIRFFELTLPETFIQWLKIKIHVPEKGSEIAIRKNKSILYFLEDVTRNVFYYLMVFLFVTLAYGALVDWFFISGFIKPLVSIIIAFLAFHLVLKYGV